jgi:hypothetical protein
MKFSTRKKLLKDADLILAEIRKNVKKSKVKYMNEIDWKEHEKWLANDPEWVEYEPAYKDIEGTKYMIDTITKIKLKKLEDKYNTLSPNEYTPEQKEQEINQMLKDIDFVRKHITKRERISKDSELQNDVQKVLANRPIITPKEIQRHIKENPNEDPITLYTDPATGLLWHYNTGAPMAPVEWYMMMKQHDLNPESLKRVTDMIGKGIAHQVAGTVEWDNSRSWLWNVLGKIFSGTSQ